MLKMILFICVIGQMALTSCMTYKIRVSAEHKGVFEFDVYCDGRLRGKVTKTTDLIVWPGLRPDTESYRKQNHRISLKDGSREIAYFIVSEETAHKCEKIHENNLKPKARKLVKKMLKDHQFQHLNCIDMFGDTKSGSDSLGTTIYFHLIFKIPSRETISEGEDKCPKCGKEKQAGKFCPFCGQKYKTKSTAKQ